MMDMGFKTAQIPCCLEVPLLGFCVCSHVRHSGDRLHQYSNQQEAGLNRPCHLGQVASNIR